MASHAEALAEAYRRGLLPPEQKAAYEEALRRGVVTSSSSSRAAEDARKRAERLDARDGRRNQDRGRALMQGYTFGFGDELQAGAKALGVGARNLVGLGPGYTAGEAYGATLDLERQRLKDYERDAPLESLGTTIVGGVVNPTSVMGGGLIGGARTAGGATARSAVVGGAMGAVSGAGAAEGGLIPRAKGAVTGAGTGVITGAAVQGLAGSLGRSATRARAAAATNPARQLANEGIILTPGQMAGGLIKRVEDAATSIPLTGDLIRGAQREGLKTFDRAAINRVLEPLGETLPESIDVGREGVRAARQAVSSAYEKALGNVQVLPDAELFDAVAVAAKSHNLRGSAADELATVVADLEEAIKKPLTGIELKALDEELGQAARSVPQGPSGRALKRSIGQLQEALDAQLGRASPAALEGKRAADEAFANLVRIEGAAGSVGAKGGMFTPAQLQSAVRSADRSARKGAFARGEALMQDLSDRAVDVLPQSVPDSGTAMRGLVAAGPVGLISSAGSLPLGLLYTKPAQDFINSVYRAAAPGEARALLGQLTAAVAANPGLRPLEAELRARLTRLANDQEQ